MRCVASQVSHVSPGTSQRFPVPPISLIASPFSTAFCPPILSYKGAYPPPVTTLSPKPIPTNNARLRALLCQPILQGLDRGCLIPLDRHVRQACANGHMVPKMAWIDRVGLVSLWLRV